MLVTVRDGWARSRLLRWVLGVMLLGSLLSCGGGGGGGGGSSDASASSTGGFTVSLDKNEISLTSNEGESSDLAVVTATPQGQLPNSLYVLAIANSPGLQSPILATLTNKDAKFPFRPDSTLPPGVYKGTVMLYACADAKCTQPIGGTPLPVAFTVTILKVLKVGGVQINAVSGQSQSASGQLTVLQLPSGATDYSTKVLYGGEWLSLGEKNGLTQALNAKSLRSGTYSASVEVTSGTQTRTVGVYYVVTPPPGGEFDLRVSTSSMTFVVADPAATVSQSVEVGLPTWGNTREDLHYSIDYDQSVYGEGWLKVRPTDTGLLLSASGVSLSRGSYSAWVKVTHPSTDTWQWIRVAFTVGQNLILPADHSIKLLNSSSQADLQGSFNIALSAGPAEAWTATSAAPWLKLTRTSGLTGEKLGYTIDQSALGAMPSFSDIKGVITLTPVNQAIAPVSFNVIVRKALAELRYAGPYALTSGRAATIHLRGQGFNGVPDIIPYLNTPGVVASSATRLNDGQIKLEVPALQAGTYILTLGNNLDVPTHAVKLSVVDPVDYGYAAIPREGAPIAVLYDPVRKAIFTGNLYTGELFKYTFESGRWVEKMTSVLGLNNFGIGPDGDTLLTGSYMSSFRLWSTDTLENTFELGGWTSNYNGYGKLGNGIPATNDGRSWVGRYYFDHWNKTFALSTSSVGSVLSVDGSGERLWGSSGYYGNPQFAFYMDATDGVAHVNPPMDYVSDAMSVSANGERVVVGASEVRDSGFKLIGFLARQEANYQLMSATPSPDGKRTYVLAFPVFDYMRTHNPAYDTALPRIYVMDSSVRPSVGNSLPIVASFDIKDYPTPCTLEYRCAESYESKMTISPDGRTLFIAGGKKLIVVPVSMAQAMPNSVAAAGRAQAMSVSTTGGGVAPKPVAQPWVRYAPK
ncbi:MAG: hypothetical protein HY019_06350 [Aquabacterium sp.]|uniref:hypothetical protein n=1 Tax=Aquabacterium sp. TaxID=1872578 RepID=UPI0025C0D22D|nr:hypothetical protein [Aquabacterium sp.]MBI3381609.1 hypothetical protein [Aquabacterium sp.]